MTVTDIRIESIYIYMYIERERFFQSIASMLCLQHLPTECFHWVPNPDHFSEQSESISESIACKFTLRVCPLVGFKLREKVYIYIHIIRKRALRCVDRPSLTKMWSEWTYDIRSKRFEHQVQLTLCLQLE